MSKKDESERIIATLGLQPLPGEGGLFRSTWAGPALPGGRAMGSAIYYMLAGGAFSHLHRLDADEAYHFYAGDPVALLLLGPNGEGCRVVLGSNVLAGQVPQQVVPAGTWQGSRLLAGGAWALMGTTMGPGYTQAGYTHGSREELSRQYPGWAEEIIRLTNG